MIHATVGIAEFLWLLTAVMLWLAAQIALVVGALMLALWVCGRLARRWRR